MTTIELKVHEGPRFADYVARAVASELAMHGLPVEHDGETVRNISLAIITAGRNGEHLIEDHKGDACFVERCYVCEGGLQYCLVCHGGEASLPTKCPGYPMSNDQKDQVQGLTLDFVNGGWLVTKPVLFGAGLRAVDASTDGIPRMAGYEITFTPGHERAEWVATPLPAKEIPKKVWDQLEPNAVLDRHAAAHPVPGTALADDIPF